MVELCHVEVIGRITDDKIPGGRKAAVHILAELSVDFVDISIFPNGIFEPFSGVVLNQDLAVVIDDLDEAFLVKAIYVEEVCDRNLLELQVQYETDIETVVNGNA